MISELVSSGNTVFLCINATQVPGRVAQSVTCLATDACLTADPGVASSINSKLISELVSSGNTVFLCINATQVPGRVAQSVTCLATDACLTADPGVASSIPVRSHTFVEIDHEMISTVILLLPLIHSRRVVVSYKRKYVHELLVNRLFKPAQEKVWLGELTIPQ